MQIALYFGSFNPIHVGHLIVAQSVVELSHIDQLWFIVSPQSPFKEKKSLLADRDRLHMVNEAIKDNDQLRSSDIEFTMPKPSYTIDTLVYLNEKFPKHSFHLTMGGDNLEHLHKWKNYDLLIKDYPIIVYPRPGYHVKEIKEADLTIMDTSLLNISASQIRKRLKEGLSVKYFLTEPVHKYVMEMSFYK